MSYYLDLFNGDPSGSGTSILSAVTGSATRSDITDDLVESDYYRALINPDVIVVAEESESTSNVSWVALYNAATAGTLTNSAPIGAHFSIMQGRPVQFLALDLKFTITISAPTLTQSGLIGNDTPELTSAFDSTARSGDTLVLEYGTDPDFVGGSSTSHVLDSSDITAGEYTFTVGPLALTTWYFRSRDTRLSIVSPWSNKVTVELVSPGGYVPTYYLLGF